MHINFWTARSDWWYINHYISFCDFVHHQQSNHWKAIKCVHLKWKENINQSWLTLVFTFSYISFKFSAWCAFQVAYCPPSSILRFQRFETRYVSPEGHGSLKFVISQWHPQAERCWKKFHYFITGNVYIGAWSDCLIIPFICQWIHL